MGELLMWPEEPGYYWRYFATKNSPDVVEAFMSVAGNISIRNGVGDVIVHPSLGSGPYRKGGWRFLMIDKPGLDEMLKLRVVRFVKQIDETLTQGMWVPGSADDEIYTAPLEGAQEENREAEIQTIVCPPELRDALIKLQNAAAYLDDFNKRPKP